MKVYIATAGEYSDYRICHVFAREEDARAYARADDVEEHEVLESAIEVRPWHTLRWNPDQPDFPRDGRTLGNPWTVSDDRDFDGKPDHVEHSWQQRPDGKELLTIQGWDHDRIMKVYSEQRSQHIAREQGVSC